jgi:exodeoxyribonuclease VII large subunit
MPSSYSLYELNEYIKRVIALNFPEPIWVNCEIAQIKEVKGNVYLDLIHHDDTTNDVTAQMSAVIWYKSYLFIKNKLGTLLPSLLDQGVHVQVKVQVEYSEKYGMKLNIEDIDPSFTIGQMEMKRQKILQKLQDEGFMHLNKLLDMPAVLQKIAVISSPKAAGYIDFVHHLRDNNYGYTFDITLYQAALQGLNTEKDVCNALRKINENSSHFDCILLLRGGGSKPDLAWFDNYNIGTSIAQSTLPVITGIGHDIDSTVADSVAYLSIKTPTAAADFIIEHNLKFESKFLQVNHWISQISRQMLKQQEVSLAGINRILQILPADVLRKYKGKIEMTQQLILQATQNKINHHHQSLDLASRQIKLSDPAHVLQRGYTIVRQGGKVVSKAHQLDVNNTMEIQFSDQTIKILSHE